MRSNEILGISKIDLEFNLQLSNVKLLLFSYRSTNNTHLLNIFFVIKYIPMYIFNVVFITEISRLLKVILYRHS